MMVMEDMLKDFLLGEHLLLVGNQVSNTWKIVALPTLLQIPLFPEKSPVGTGPRGPVRITAMIILLCHVKKAKLRLVPAERGLSPFCSNGSQ